MVNALCDHILNYCYFCYCYHLVNIITFGQAQSDNIKWLLLYKEAVKQGRTQCGKWKCTKILFLPHCAVVNLSLQSIKIYQSINDILILINMHRNQPGPESVWHPPWPRPENPLIWRPRDRSFCLSCPNEHCREAKMNTNEIC